MLIFHLHSACFLQAVLRLHLHLGQCVIMNSPLSQELDNMQHSLRGFYSTCHDGRKFHCLILHLIGYFMALWVLSDKKIKQTLAGVISYGPFMKLPREIQEISICCLYYFSFLDPSLLQSLAACCLCEYFSFPLIFIEKREYQRFSNFVIHQFF